MVTCGHMAPRRIDSYSQLFVSALAIFLPACHSMPTGLLNIRCWIQRTARLSKRRSRVRDQQGDLGTNLSMRLILSSTRSLISRISYSAFVIGCHPRNQDYFTIPFSRGIFPWLVRRSRWLSFSIQC
ncbi:hypothetical protein L210DRAFT_230998 [Boletus edulis BED1]|uniref:Uncharacterized protein n=1 Tax=Boletus edulis BED1 TaxID=1328754 RepID=A0AAD4BG54_BOLED|nr:hypothetical protein L210DRAFT_230998 [Boletus edulis BED1]